MKKKANLVIITSSILVGVMVVIIFAFSTQGGQNSTSISGSVVDYIIEKAGLQGFIYNYEWLYNHRNYIFRKILHFTEYAILATLMFNSLKFRKVRLKLASIWTLLFVFIVAVADEIYQSHIPGRTPRIRDVLIDTCGAFTAVMTILFSIKLFGRFKKGGAY